MIRTPTNPRPMWSTALLLLRMGVSVWGGGAVIELCNECLGMVRGAYRLIPNNGSGLDSEQPERSETVYPVNYYVYVRVSPLDPWIRIAHYNIGTPRRAANKFVRKVMGKDVRLEQCRESVSVIRTATDKKGRLAHFTLKSDKRLREFKKAAERYIMD